MRRLCRHFVRDSSARASILLSLSVSLVLPSSAWGESLGLDVERYQYISPIPGSRLVSPWNNIVIRHGSRIDARTLEAAALIVIGSISGRHDGDLTLSDDTKTLIFEPHEPFSLGERISVTLEQGVKAFGGDPLPPLAFDFFVTTADPRQQPRLALEELLLELPSEPSSGSSPVSASSGPFTPRSCDLPPDYPIVTVTVSREPEPGYVFIVPFGRPFASSPGHLLIVDNLGMPIFYRKISGGAIDLKMQPNGLLTYFDRGKAVHFVLDSSYTVIDSVVTGNGYVTDLHDLQLLPDNHWLLMSYDPQPVRMDTIVTGGRPNAIVVGLIVQELDQAKNVVFQWRSWDHMEITDSVIPLTGARVDYVHGNAVELDHDGNILICSRNLNEITKVDRQTGDILWRLGLHARNNEFDFVNDPRSFWFQHDIRRLPNGNITLYDNGNGHHPVYSRGVEYRLDEVEKTATLVWEYRNTPDVFGPVMGNVQRRASGGTMMGWGFPSTNLRLTDVHPEGSKAFELNLPTDVLTYRAFRFPWRTTAFVTDVESLDFGSVAVGRSATLPLSVHNRSASDITISCFLSSDPMFSVEAPVPITLTPGETVTVNVSFVPPRMGQFPGKLYVRTVTSTELIAQDVALEGAGAAEVAFDLDPNAFHLGSLGKWATGYLESSEPFAAGEFVLSSIHLNGQVKVDLTAPHTIGDHDDDGVADLMVKFSRRELAMMLPPGERVPVTVTGLIGTESFVGYDTVKVKSGKVLAPGHQEVIPPGRPYTVRYQVSPGEPTQHVALLHSFDQGASWTSDLSHQPNTGEMVWHVPGRTAENVRVAVLEVGEEGDSDQVLGVMGVSGLFTIAGPLAVAEAPRSLAFAAAQPNPSLGTALLRFGLPRGGEVSLAVYDVLGRRVRTLVSGTREAGWHEVRWRNKTDTGEPVGAGLYFILLRVQGQTLTQRVVRLR